MLDEFGYQKTRTRNCEVAEDSKTTTTTMGTGFKPARQGVERNSEMKQDHELLNTQLNVRVPTRLKKLIERDCAEIRMSPSEYVRGVMDSVFHTNKGNALRRQIFH